MTLWAMPGLTSLFLTESCFLGPGALKAGVTAWPGTSVSTFASRDVVCGGSFMG